MGRKRKMLNNLPATSIRQKAYLYIQRKISKGELAAGDAISEVDLAKELGSSRTPIREALSQLIAEGLLEQSSGGGIVVKQFTREDILDFCELREALETYALSKIARVGLMKPEDKERLQVLVDGILVLRDELVKSGQSALSHDQMNRFISVDFSFHALLMELSQNVRIHKVVNETRLLMWVFSLRRQGHSVADLERIHAQHQELLNAIERQDLAATVKTISLHLQESQRERLSEFDHSKRESAFKRSMPTFLDLYNPVSHDDVQLPISTSD